MKTKEDGTAYRSAVMLAMDPWMMTNGRVESEGLVPGLPLCQGVQHAMQLRCLVGVMAVWNLRVSVPGLPSQRLENSMHEGSDA